MGVLQAVVILNLSDAISMCSQLNKDASIENGLSLNVMVRCAACS